MEAGINVVVVPALVAGAVMAVVVRPGPVGAGVVWPVLGGPAVVRTTPCVPVVVLEAPVATVAGVARVTVGCGGDEEED